MDKCTQDMSLPRHAAVKNMLEHCRFDRKTEKVTNTEGYGRVLAEDVVSQNTLPNHLTANRDGVAVYYKDFMKGMPDTSNWQEGKEYIFANTGISIDGDYDTEILIEQVRIDEEGRIRFLSIPEKKGQSTIEPGSELKEGDLLAKAGETLTPSLMSFLAKGGHTVLPAVKKPVVSFIPTGSELVPADQKLPIGKNVDANSVLVRGKLLEWGAEPKIYPICKDDPTMLRNVLEDAIASSDIVLLNAGSSKGTDDYCHEILGEYAEIFNQQVDTGPGKHTCYAMAKNIPVVGLSGPTVCCDYTMEWYVKPVIDLFLGREITSFQTIRAKTLTDLKMTRKGLTFMMGAHAARNDREEFVVIPAGHPGEKRGMKRNVNCFIPMIPGLDVKAGELIDIELRWPFFMPEVDFNAEDEARTEPVVF